MIDWVYYRNEFPVTDNQAYFMTAGAGPIPKSVLFAINEQYRKLSEQGGNIFQKNIEIVEECRAEIAKLINAEVDEIAFVPSVSFAMNALALSLPEKIKKIKLVIPEDEFPSTSIPWLNAGYDIDFVHSNGDLSDNIEKKLLKNTHFLISSLVQYSNGYNLNINRLLPAIKSNSSSVMINATQCIGAYPIDVKALDVDVLTCACHKWMFCGEGIAFLYIKKTFFNNIEPALAGWRSSPFSMQMSNKENRFYPSARAFELGWPNMTIFSGLKASLKIINEIGVSNIQMRIQHLMNYLIQKSIEFELPVLSNLNSGDNFNILQFGPFPDLDALLGGLSEQGVFVTKRGNGIRVSLHFYNNENDIDRFIDVIVALLKQDKFK